MPTSAQQQALAEEARWIKTRDAALQTKLGASSSLLVEMDRIIHEMMRAGVDPEYLKEWLLEAVDLHDLATHPSSQAV